MIFVAHSSGGVTTRILMLDARFGAINRYSVGRCMPGKVHVRESACPRRKEGAQMLITTYPNLAQLAFDLCAIPAMSSECERSFSKASYTISARRSTLGNDIVEAGEVLRS